MTEEYVERYIEEGYVVVEGGLTDADLEPVIQDYTAIADDIAQGLYSHGRISDLYADEPFESRLARIAQEDDETYHNDNVLDVGSTRRRGTFEFLRNENLLDLVEPLVGPEIACNSITHIRAKLPADEAGERQSNVAPWHQDAIFTTMESHHILQITVWLPLCDATLENGCLHVRPGIHRQKKVFWGYDAEWDRVEPIAVPMKKGDVIFIHKLMPHGSYGNRTDGVRWSMDIRYQQAHEPSPRPEWPSLVARSRTDPSSETSYEVWRDAWQRGLHESPSKKGYERPSGVTDYEGYMFLADTME